MEVLMRRLLLAPAAVLLLVFTLSAQDTQDQSELLNRLKAMEAKIQALEAEVQSLKGQQAAAPAPGAPVAPQQVAPPAAVPEAAPQVAAAGEPSSAALPNYGGAGAAAAKVFNPDISLIGDFLAAAGNPGGRYTPSLEMHESELGLQAIIDPYVRGDVFLTFGEQGVGLEEGYFTFTSLPGALQLKAGKMRAAFGKVNTMHNHVLPWTDRPLVTQDLLGGEDGIDDAGLSLSRILPAPKGIFLEGTAQLFRGDSTNVFRAARRSDLSTVEHLRAYRDITESTNLDIGGSFSQGHSAFGYGNNRLIGIDATLRWKPLRRAIYHSFVGRAEFIWAKTGAQATLTPTAETFGTYAKPFGYYVSGDYQLARRWFLGGRFDRSERGACLPTDPAGPDTSCTFFAPRGSRFDLPLAQDTGGSILLTYWPSEFSQIRGQLRRTVYGDGRTANEALFQLILSMGAHGAHPF
jgi:hypothetical protein